MPSPQFTSFNAATGSTNLPNGVETIAVTTKPVSSSAPNCTFGLVFMGSVTVGAGATSILMQIRRQSLTGTSILGPAGFAVTASTTGLFSVGFTDQPIGDGAGLLWVLTFSVTGGAAAGTLNLGYSSVTVAQ